MLRNVHPVLGRRCRYSRIVRLSKDIRRILPVGDGCDSVDRYAIDRVLKYKYALTAIVIGNIDGERHSVLGRCCGRYGERGLSQHIRRILPVGDGCDSVDRHTIACLLCHKQPIIRTVECKAQWTIHAVLSRSTGGGVIIGLTQNIVGNPVNESPIVVRRIDEYPVIISISDKETMICLIVLKRFGTVEAESIRCIIRRSFRIQRYRRHVTCFIILAENIDGIFPIGDGVHVIDNHTVVCCISDK